uniref:Uncharacterized protein n=1 Tax=Amphimedon queenslandica TaxID=400682 RepID=A0A1X7USN4_AMPQE
DRKRASYYTSLGDGCGLTFASSNGSCLGARTVLLTPVIPAVVSVYAIIYIKGSRRHESIPRQFYM